MHAGSAATDVDRSFRQEVVMRTRLLLLALASVFVLAGSGRAITGSVTFVVLKVTFSDFPAGSRFTAAQTQTNFNSVAQLWNESSYGNLTLNFQTVGPAQVAHPSGTYLDIQSGQSSSTAAIVNLVNDAVATTSNTMNWNNVYGVVVLFADNRPGGFYRGITLPSTTPISPPSGGTFNVHASIVGESPLEDVARTWGRWGHEVGHQLQANPGNPWHPSNYNSNFEEMDGEYPAQTGVFFKQAGHAFPDWLPVGKYKSVSPPSGGALGLLIEERPPGTDPDFQAIKATLPFGGSQVYYLISARRRILGDDTATTHGPNGIPDEGVLIERVVEGGDPNLNDCTAPTDTPCPRWVNIEGNSNTDTLWHAGDTYRNTTDGIFITVRSKLDNDHYLVDVAYAEKAGRPDVGINSWLEPPGNTYESSDIWVDSPLNNLGTFRYGSWSDLMGGTVPKGNGDDPVVGIANRLYARVRNYGTQPATNVVVHFDITNPLGVGVAGSNGFVQLGTVTSADFPGLASIPPGGHVDVYLNWTPNVTLTPAQIQAGRFFFHSCVRVRIDHVANENFFANQDGDGQQENIDYFDAGSASSPGAPGAASKDVIHLRNDSPASPKQFFLSVFREQLPGSWKVTVNGGNPVVNLGPGQVRDVPVVIKQTTTEAIGISHAIRVYASSRVTLHNDANPSDKHDAFMTLGGVQFKVAVLRHPILKCRSIGGGGVVGTLTGVKDGKTRLPVYVVGLNGKGRFIPRSGGIGYAPGTGGTFKARFGRDSPPFTRGVCLFAGTTKDASAGSAIFPT
jgi:hypothetical protein